MKIHSLLKVCGIAFLLLLKLTASSQDVRDLQAQLDKTKTVEARISALDALANYYTWSDGQFQKAKDYGEKMIAVASGSGDKKMECLVYILNGIRLVESVPTADRERSYAVILQMLSVLRKLITFHFMKQVLI